MKLSDINPQLTEAVDRERYSETYKTYVNETQFGKACAAVQKWAKKNNIKLDYDFDEDFEDIVQFDDILVQGEQLGVSY